MKLNETVLWYVNERLSEAEERLEWVQKRLMEQVAATCPPERGRWIDLHMAVRSTSLDLVEIRADLPKLPRADEQKETRKKKKR